MMEFRGYQSTYVDSLPPVESTPLFQQYDSLYRLLLKACATSPDDRFGSADELRVQMLGVLREIVAQDQRLGRATGSSTLAAVRGAGHPDRPASTGIPSPASASTPPTPRPAGSTGSPPRGRPQERLALLHKAPGMSPEVHLAICRAALAAGQPDLVDSSANAMLRVDPWEWRAVWMQGLSALQQGDPRAAQSAFNAVYGQVPGELAPKLALASACEASEELDHRREPLHGVRPDRRQLHPGGRVRDGPHPHQA